MQSKCSGIRNRQIPFLIFPSHANPGGSGCREGGALHFKQHHPHMKAARVVLFTWGPALPILFSVSWMNI